MSSIFGKKKKHPKQTVNVNNSHAQTRPHIHSPGNSGFSDTSGYHSRNHSIDNGSQSSYFFQDNAPSSSLTRHSDTSSIRNSVVFSPGDWLSYYKENFGGNKEPPRPSDDEIENLFLDLMNKRDLNKLTDSQRKLIPVDQKWVLKSLSNPTKIVASAPDKNTPEYYLKKILDRSITVEDLNSLGVSLRTLTIKREVDHQMEYEILKCLKSLLNCRWGAQEALSHPTCIHSITFSLISQQLNTRKLVAEVLSFLCYCEIPTGHNLVLGGFDQLKQFRAEPGRFDAWMNILENTINSRGRYGSLVNASEEFKKGGIGIDGSIMEYVLSNMILVNSIVGVCEDVEERVRLRNQLHDCNLSRIIEKMRNLNYELINRQISKFENDSELDFEECILSSVEGTKAHDYFLSTLQQMLLIRDEGETRTRYFQLINALITQIVRDRRVPDQDLNSSISIIVSQAINKFDEQEKREAALEAALEDAREAKAIAEKALREKKELQDELSTREDGNLKSKIDSNEQLLRISRHTIQTQQVQIAEKDLLIRKYESILKEQGYSNDSDASGQHDQERRKEIAKTEAILEGQVWTPSAFEFKMPDVDQYRYSDANTSNVTTDTGYASGDSNFNSMTYPPSHTSQVYGQAPYPGGYNQGTP
ncbi:1660_t:CDS:10, partial [Funneliformis mosseae]